MRQRDKEDRRSVGELAYVGTGRALLQVPDETLLKGKRDRDLLAVLVACGLRRHDAAELKLTHLQQREHHWAIIDLVDKAAQMRTIPIPDWVKQTVDDWLTSAGITAGRIFRRVNRPGKIGATA